MTKTANQVSEDTFQKRTYGKGELASMYITGVTQQSAVNRFNKWVKKAPGLEQKLTDLGLKSTDRCYTPVQVEAIVLAFGEP